MLENVKHKTFISYDGTTIAYQDIGKGRPIVLANGLGGSYEAWAYIIRHLVDAGYRILSWDYRGLFKSGRPDLSRVSIPDHVEDLTRLLDIEGIDRALFLGWSMGTQVILEHAVRRPERTAGLFLICGAAGRPFDTALYTSTSRFTMPVIFRAMRSVHKQFGAVMKKLVAIPHGIDAITATKLFWRGGSEIIKGMVNEYADLDFETYAQIMIELGRHDARPFLTSLDIPAFLVAATRDFFTPVDVAKKMQKLIAGCELEILEGATHYAPLEFPEKINAFLDTFIAERVKWGDAKKVRQVRQVRPVRRARRAR